MIPEDEAPSLNQTTLKIIALYRTDYWQVFHSRAIARNIDRNIQTVTVQLSKLVKAGILKSARRGKNLEFGLELGNIITKYYLSLAETYVTLAFLNRDFLVKKVVQELQQYEGAPLPGILVLFGSFAAENFTDQSDIDILAITGASFDQLALREIGAVIGREINVKTMTESTFVKGIRHPLPFVQEVTKCHVVLQGIDRFCSLMWNGFGIWRR